MYLEIGKDIDPSICGSVLRDMILNSITRGCSWCDAHVPAEIELRRDDRIIGWLNLKSGAVRSSEPGVLNVTES
jgi:hypothetical protein